LPYIEETGVSKVHGVNYFDENYHIKVEYVNHKYAQEGYFGGNCAYVVKDAFENLIECSTKYVKNLNLDNKCYCSHHKLLMMKKYMLDRKNKAKLEAKEKAKQEKEKAKQEKEKVKQAKLEAKQAKLQATEENVVLQHELCAQILKTGPNKGNPCGKKVHKDHLCLRHFPKVDPNPTHI
jgi:ATP-dependent protease HslVU (ClpYQ) ATPase subunit